MTAFKGTEKFRNVEHRGGSRKSFAPPPWSHQAELKLMKGKSIELCINMVTTIEVVIGIVLNSDNFTIQIKETDGRVWIFQKSSIISFREKVSQ